MQKKLCDFAIGESGKVTNVLSSGTEGIKIRRRLFDMGVTPGATVTLKKRAPLGDPIEITLRGYQLTLRKKEAKMVVVEVEQ